MVPFCPLPFCPAVPFCPNIPCSILPPRLLLERSYYVNYIIARCSIKWCENENKRYSIISNHMQRFYNLICQSNWCQNASKLIYKNDKISFLWDTQNVVYCKFDFDVWHWTGQRQKSSGRENRPTPGMLFSKHPVFHFAPMFHFAPTYYICFIRADSRFAPNQWETTLLCKGVSHCLGANVGSALLDMMHCIYENVTYQA